MTDGPVCPDHPDHFMPCSKCAGAPCCPLEPAYRDDDVTVYGYRLVTSDRTPPCTVWTGLVDRSGMGEQVVQRWAYVSGLVHRRFVEDAPAKAAFERAERLNAAARAMRDGFVPVPGSAVVVTWEPLTDIGIEMLARVARDLDGRVSEEGFENATEAEIEAEENRRRAAVRGSQQMRVEFDVYADAEEPELVSMARDTHAVLAAEGAQVLADKDSSVLLCGGALRRHKFSPRDAAWLRDGAIQGARCLDCGERVTREELLRRQFLEDQHGTCPVCGDVLEEPSRGRLDASCPTCREAGRE